MTKIGEKVSVEGKYIKNNRCSCCVSSQLMTAFLRLCLPRCENCLVGEERERERERERPFSLAAEIVRERSVSCSVASTSLLLVMCVFNSTSEKVLKKKIEHPVFRRKDQRSKNNSNAIFSPNFCEK